MHRKFPNRYNKKFIDNPLQLLVISPILYKLKNILYILILSMLKSVKETLANDSIDILGAEDSVRNLPFIQQVAAGSAAGMCEHLALFPVDTIKVAELKR